MVPSRAIYQLGDDNALLFPGRRLRPARSFFPFLLSRAGEGRDDNTRWGGHRSKGKADKFENLYCWVWGRAKRERRGPKKIPSPRPIDSLPPLKKSPLLCPLLLQFGRGNDVSVSAREWANNEISLLLTLSPESWLIHNKSEICLGTKEGNYGASCIPSLWTNVPEATYESIDVRSKCLSNHHARRRRRRGEGVTQKVFVAISLGGFRRLEIFRYNTNSVPTHIGLLFCLLYCTVHLQK